MQLPTEGAIYEDKHTDCRIKCVDTPDIFGLSTMEAENKQIWFENLESETKFSIFVDNFQRGYKKIAESEAELTA